MINTLFYAAVWCGLLFGFTSAKRAMRRKRGRCLHCGYDLTGLPSGWTCPECGQCQDEAMGSQGIRQGEGL